MSRRSIVVVTIALILLVLGGAWLATKIERFTRFRDTGAELSVLLNPWFAAQAFLKQQNIESHRSFNLHPVLERLKPYDSLILFNSTPIANPSTQRRLLDWVHAGGHLIITAHKEWDFDLEASEDTFLDQFGVRFYSLIEEYEEYDEDEEFEVDDITVTTENTVEPEIGSSVNDSELDNDELISDEADDQSAQSCIFTNYDNLFNIHLDQHILQIEALADYSLDDEFGEANLTANHWPNALLQYPVGAGKLTVIMDPSIWHNDRIGDYDHAYFLWHLIQKDDTIWFVSSNESENLMELLWRTAPYLIISLVAMLLVWSWRRWVRFGPMVPEPSNAHRQLLEHIEASTRFEWNHHQTKPMLEQLRHDIQQQIARTHNLSFEAQQSDWLQFVAQRCDLTPEQILQAMLMDSPTKEHAWTDLISQLQNIRNTL